MKFMKFRKKTTGSKSRLSKSSVSRTPLRRRLRPTDTPPSVRRPFMAASFARRPNQITAVNVVQRPKIYQADRKVFLPILRNPLRSAGLNLFIDPLRDVRTQTGALTDRKEVTRTSICHRRGARRRVLFTLKIAGKGLKKSPGKGGSYNRTPDSLVSC